MKELEREVRELRRANQIREKRQVFCPGGARPPTEVIVAFIGEHGDEYGVEPMCSVLPIALSTYHEQTHRYVCRP